MLSLKTCCFLTKNVCSLQVMDFINDAIASLDAFVDAYKPAAIYFSFPVELRQVHFIFENSALFVVWTFQ